MTNFFLLTFKLLIAQLHTFLYFRLKMWHFVKGVEPPKRKQTTEERKERNVSYEKRHKRGFQSTWQVNRPWLRVENISDEEVLFCDYCIKAGVSSQKTSFIKGCKSL